MAILRQEDLVNGGEIVIVSGVVERIVIKEAERTAKNLEFGVTHVASIVVDGQWINFISLSIKENRDPDISINTGTKAQPKWATVNEGDEVRVVVQETVKGDKTYYNAKKSGIKLVKKNASPQAAKSSGTTNNYNSKPKDTTGISVGHSLNGAINFVTSSGADNSNESIIEVAKKVHDVTERLKEEYAKANPGLSAYDVGAAVGNSVLNACRMAPADGDFQENVYHLAKDLLLNVAPEILKYVKGEDTPAPVAKVTRAPAKPKAPTKAKKVEEPVEVEEADYGDEGFDNMGDSDIPF